MPTPTEGQSANTQNVNTQQVQSDTDAKNNLDTILSIGVKASQIAGAITQQRKSSGKSASRQDRIAKCGRAPIFGRAKKEEYRKCVASLGGETMTDGDVNKSNYTPPPPTGMSTTTKLLIGFGAIAVGLLAYKYFKK